MRKMIYVTNTNDPVKLRRLPSAIGNGRFLLNSNALLSIHSSFCKWILSSLPLPDIFDFVTISGLAIMACLSKDNKSYETEKWKEGCTAFIAYGTQAWLQQRVRQQQATSSKQAETRVPCLFATATTTKWPMYAKGRALAFFWIALIFFSSIASFSVFLSPRRFPWSIPIVECGKYSTVLSFFTVEMLPPIPNVHIFLFHIGFVSPPSSPTGGKTLSVRCWS